MHRVPDMPNRSKLWPENRMPKELGGWCSSSLSEIPWAHGAKDRPNPCETLGGGLLLHPQTPQFGNFGKANF